jgi:hypoxanthine-guanine phosphoribosyltransferase
VDWERAAFMFTADLVREVTCPHVVDMIKVSSYEGTQSSG